MLNFDDSHKSIEGNIKEKTGHSTLKKIIALGFLAVSLFTFSGCAKTIPCEIEGDHAHYYVNSQNIGRYIISEKSYIGRLNRTDEYIKVNEEEKEFINFLNKKKLFNVEANREGIDNYVATHGRYLEYEYEDEDLECHVSYDEDGNADYTYTWVTYYRWTDDANRKDLTGDERLCTQVYFGYKLEKQPNGSIKVVRSPYSYYSIDEMLADGYNHIKDDFHRVVYSYDKDKINEFKAEQAEQQKINSEASYTEEVSEKTAGM